MSKFVVSLNTGEFIKYLSNTLLATLINYSNEMAQLADNIGEIDVVQAFRILHMDKRWGGWQQWDMIYQRASESVSHPGTAVQCV